MDVFPPLPLCHSGYFQPDQLTLHADRGSSMKSKTVAYLLADLGVTKTHSRPHVSNDKLLYMPPSSVQLTSHADLSTKQRFVGTATYSKAFH